MRTQYGFKIGSFALALHARNVAISTNLGEIIYFETREGKSILPNVRFAARAEYES